MSRCVDEPPPPPVPPFTTEQTARLTELLRRGGHADKARRILTRLGPLVSSHPRTKAGRQGQPRGAQASAGVIAQENAQERSAMDQGGRS
jgi:hypothetical protein